MFIFKFRSRFRFWFRFSFVGQALMQNHQQARITCFFDWLIDHKKNALQVFSCFNVFKSCRVESSQVESSRKNPHKTHKTHITLILLEAGWRHIESQKGGPNWPNIAFRHSNVFFSDVFQTDQIPSLCRGYQVIIQFQTCVSLCECSAIQNQTVWFVNE